MTMILVEVLSLFAFVASSKLLIVSPTLKTTNETKVRIITHRNVSVTVKENLNICWNAALKGVYFVKNI